MSECILTVDPRTNVSPAGMAGYDQNLLYYLDENHYSRLVNWVVSPQSILHCCEKGTLQTAKLNLRYWYAKTWI